MVHHGDGLGIRCAEQPAFHNPIRLKFLVESRQPRQEARQKFFFFQPEVFVVGLEVVPQVDDVIASKVGWREEVGVLDQ